MDENGTGAVPTEPPTETPPIPPTPPPDPPPGATTNKAGSPPKKTKLTDEEAALTPRKEITVKQAKVLFRDSIFTDEDLIRKSGMGPSSVKRFWKGDLPKKGMAWRGIAGVLEQILVDHIRIKP